MLGVDHTVDAEPGVQSFRHRDLDGLRGYAAGQFRCSTVRAMDVKLVDTVSNKPIGELDSLYKVAAKVPLAGAGGKAA
jgi:hypothetical protein